MTRSQLISLMAAMLHARYPDPGDKELRMRLDIKDATKLADMVEKQEKV